MARDIERDRQADRLLAEALDRPEDERLGFVERAWYSRFLTFEGNHSSYNSNWCLSVFEGQEFVFRNNRAYGNTDGGLDYPSDEGHVNAGGNYPIP